MTPTVKRLLFGSTNTALTRDWVARGGVFESSAQRQAVNRLSKTLTDSGDITLFRYLNLRIGGLTGGLLVPFYSVNTTLDTNSGLVAGNYANATGITWTGAASITTGLTRAESLLASGGTGYGCALVQTGASTECMGVLGSGAGAGRVLLNPNFSTTTLFINLGDLGSTTPGITTLTRAHVTSASAGSAITLYRNGASSSVGTSAEIAAGGTNWAVGRGPNAIAGTGCRILCDWVTTHTSAAQWARIDAALAQFLSDIGRS